MLPRFQIQTFVWHPIEVIIESDTRPILLGKLLVGLVIVAHEDRLELSRQIGMALTNMQLTCRMYSMYSYKCLSRVEN